jgi:hypothetical protein
MLRATSGRRFLQDTLTKPDCQYYILRKMSSSAGRKRPLVSATSSTQKKRKTDPNMQKYYAVRTGMRPGVYLTWDECQAQTTGFRGASCEFYSSFLMFLSGMRALFMSVPS